MRARNVVTDPVSKIKELHVNKSTLGIKEE
jgi:hypothetical protein